MRELRSCDFCGGDAAGTFAIVPPELEPSEAEQRRVVLCPDCKARLETLIEPLLARAGADDAASVDGDREAESGTVAASADASTRKRSRTSSPNATVSDGDAASLEDDDTATDAESDAADPDAERDPESASEPDSESELESEPRADSASRASDSDGSNSSGDSDDSTDATGSAAESPLEEGITFGADEGADGRSTETDEAPDTSGSAAEKSAKPNESTGSNASDAATRPPSAYSKVVRLLRNREFPMQRSAVEELAAGAYDLEPDEVDAIVDYAIEQGEFVEKRGKLTRP